MPSVCSSRSSSSSPTPAASEPLPLEALVTNVYTRMYVGLPCLIGSVLCQEADLTGRYGKF